MITYSKFRPTGFDCARLCLPERQDWFVAPAAQNRDSGTLDRANWKAQLEQFKEYPDDYEIHRFGHWANGWFEIVLINPSSPLVEIAEDIENGLADYVIISDSIFSEEENNTVLTLWNNLSRKERREICEKYNVPVKTGTTNEKVWTELLEIVHSNGI